MGGKSTFRSARYADEFMTLMRESEIMKTSEEVLDKFVEQLMTCAYSPEGCERIRWCPARISSFARSMEFSPINPTIPRPDKFFGTREKIACNPVSVWL